MKYIIDKNERPVFHYTYDDVSVTDKIVPANSDAPGLERTIIIENGVIGDAVLIASGSNIEIVANGWINVNGKYYLIPSPAMEKEMQIIDDVGIVMPVSSSKINIQYTVVW